VPPAQPVAGLRTRTQPAPKWLECKRENAGGFVWLAKWSRRSWQAQGKGIAL